MADVVIRRLKSYWVAFLKIATHSLNTFYDFLRYLRYSNFLILSTSDRQKLESLIFLEYHKIEKALALPAVRPLFGLGYLETLLDLLDRWGRLTNDYDAIVFRGALAALASYREQVGETLKRSRYDLFQRLDKLLTDHAPEVDEHGLGGVLPINGIELKEACQSVNFDKLVFCRHSVRNFAECRVPDDIISHAVRIAQQSPSVCNRQCWRVHVFTSDLDKSKVLQTQSGNSGFGHLADRVLLLTADLRCFVSAGERNQAHQDAGMFAMTLIYAFQAQGVVSCCLNLCTNFYQDIALRRVCKIPEWETPIMMIVIGYSPVEFKVAVSSRVYLEAILSFRNLMNEPNNSSVVKQSGTVYDNDHTPHPTSKKGELDKLSS
jgi:nitroreductase